MSDLSEAVQVEIKPQTALIRKADTVIIAAVLEKPYLMMLELGWATNSITQTSALMGSLLASVTRSDVSCEITYLNLESLVINWV